VKFGMSVGRTYW